MSRNENKPGYDGEQLRDRVANILSKNINFKPEFKLTFFEQRSALKELKSNNDIKVVPFDKGSGFAVMTKDDMMLKMKRKNKFQLQKSSQKIQQTPLSRNSKFNKVD